MSSQNTIPNSFPEVKSGAKKEETLQSFYNHFKSLTDYLLLKTEKSAHNCDFFLGNTTHNVKLLQDSTGLSEDQITAVPLINTQMEEAVVYFNKLYGMYAEFMSKDTDKPGIFAFLRSNSEKDILRHYMC